MAITAYKILKGTVSTVADEVQLTIGSWQPYLQPFVSRDGYVCQVVVQGVPTGDGTLPSGSVAVSDGDTIAVVNSAGGNSHNSRVSVTSGVLTNTGLDATVAMVDDAGMVVVHNSANAVVSGTHTAQVSNGVLNDVKLDAVVVPVTNGASAYNVTTSGTGTAAQFTVVSGAITAITFSTPI